MVDRKGFLMTPGKSTEQVTLRDNKRIVFEDQQQKSTKDHGNWHEFITTDHTNNASIDIPFQGERRRLDAALVPLFRSRRLQDAKLETSRLFPRRIQ